MPRYVVAKNTGEIVRVISGSARYIEVDNDASIDDQTHYANDDNEVLKRRGLTFEHQTDGLIVTLSGLPSGVRVRTNGVETVTDTEPLVVTYDIPGTYEIGLSGHLEYLSETLEVTLGDA